MVQEKKDDFSWIYTVKDSSSAVTKKMTRRRSPWCHLSTRITRIWKPPNRVNQVRPQPPWKNPPPAVTRFNMIRDSLQSRPSSCQPGSSTQPVSVIHAEPLVDMPGGSSTYTSQPPKPRTVMRQPRDSLVSNDSRARLIFLLKLCEN